jgi:hypothetical protein
MPVKKHLTDHPVPFTKPTGSAQPLASPDEQDAAADNTENQPALLRSSHVAQLLEIEDITLRNYVWLLRLTKRERIARHLQHPPQGMPKPKKIRGRLYWDAQRFHKWNATRKKLLAT